MSSNLVHELALNSLKWNVMLKSLQFWKRIQNFLLNNGWYIRVNLSTPPRNVWKCWKIEMQEKIAAKRHTPLDRKPCTLSGIGRHSYSFTVLLIIKRESFSGELWRWWGSQGDFFHLFMLPMNFSFSC